MNHRYFPRIVRTSDAPGGKIVSQDSKLIFHHLPKTAGSTFRRILEIFFNEDDIFPGEIDDEVVAEINKGSDKIFFAGHFTYDLLLKYFPNDIWLTFLRDPIDRLISNYYNLNNPKRHTRNWLQRAEKRPETLEFLANCREWSLQEFLESDHPMALNRKVNYQTRHIISRSNNKFGDSTENFIEYDEDILAQAKENLRNRFQFVGVQEQFDTSLQLFAMTFGIRPIPVDNFYTDNINPSKKGFQRNYREELSPELLDYLVEKNRMDLELLEFSEELIKERTNLFLNNLLDETADNKNQLLYNKGKFGKAAQSKQPQSVLLSDSVALRGFYRREKDGVGREFHWTGYENPAVIDFKLQAIEADTIEIEIHTVNLKRQDYLNSITVLLNDLQPIKIDVKNTITSGKIIATYNIPTGSIGPMIACLKLNVPSELENDDVKHRRRIGIAVHKIAIRAVN